MQIEEIRVMTHFGQHKAADFFVRTADGRHVHGSVPWSGEHIDERELTAMLAKFAKAVVNAAVVVEPIRAPV